MAPLGLDGAPLLLLLLLLAAAVASILRPAAAAAHAAGAAAADEDYYDDQDGDAPGEGPGTFDAAIEAHPHILVEFYAPWCGHCKALAPEYAEAATRLKAEGSDIVLAKIDGSKDNRLSQQYGVQGFPTLLFFRNAQHREYKGGRTADEIVTWLQKKTGPAINSISSASEVEDILAHEDVVAVAYFDKLEGPAFEELQTLAQDEDATTFLQTTDADVADALGLKKSETKAPALAVLKKEEEKFVKYDGHFDKDEMATFVKANRLPLVITFNTDTASAIFDDDNSTQLLLFASPDDSDRLLPEYEAAAKKYKGKVMFVHVNNGDEEASRSVLEFFGVTGQELTLMAFSMAGPGTKYKHERDINQKSIEGFAADLVEGKLTPYFKSEPLPSEDDGDVKIVVGKNFDSIVLDESKDVLLEVYAPWCGHCQELAPTWLRLAKRFSSVDSVVIAKMDGTTNEHPRISVEGFPSLLFYAAGNKSVEPIPVDVDRTLKSLTQFIKKYASIPFVLPRKGDLKQMDLDNEALDSSAPSREESVHTEL
eukprot:SM000032S12040  [mRNA]  locus=s32:119433:124518:+ [translate_table: standard]